jgi:hypothetical protein
MLKSGPTPNDVQQEGRAVTMCLRRLVLFMFGVCWLSGGATAGPVEPDSVLEAISWIEHQAGLVESARGNFTVKHLPTTTEEMDRISAWCRFRDNAQHASAYCVTAVRATRRSYYVDWWRQGVKERLEKTHIARPAIVETTVFDGELVTTLDGTPGRTSLYIGTPDSHWTHQSRIQPFAFALEYRSARHGDILRASPERRIVRRRDPETGAGRWELTAQHPTDDRLMLRWLYDDEHRLLSRDAILTRSSSFMELVDDQPAVYSRWEFSDFRPYDTGRGASIMFPSRAMVRFYVGTLADGSLVQSSAMQVEVGDIDFNVDIPAETFKLTPPEGVRVRDLRDSDYSAIGVSY